jgi:hypothetical protein
MKLTFQSESALADESSLAPLDLVIPVTTPELTRASIRAAEQLACGIHAQVRLLKIQVVPFPLQISAPPVPVEFLRAQLEKYSSSLPVKREIELARDFEPALRKALRPRSVVLICSKRRGWRTHNERLAADLRRSGYPVILTFESDRHA